MNPKTKILILLIAIIIVIITIVSILIFSSPNKTEENSERKQACIDLGCPEGSLYAGSINSDKFYFCTCGYAKNINPENLVCFSDEATALADNRTKSDC